MQEGEPYLWRCVWEGELRAINLVMEDVFTISPQVNDLAERASILALMMSGLISSNPVGLTL